MIFLGAYGLMQPEEQAELRRKGVDLWRKARALVGMSEGFRFYDLRHTGHTLATRSGATLKDTMVRAGQSSEPH